MVSGTRTLGVWMNGLRVGTMTKDAAGALAFGYVPEWLATSGARPISLSMPLRHQPHRGEVVYNFFDNLLPDNQQIRNRIQSRFKAPSSHPFDLLAAIGMDCAGAIQIVPDHAPPLNVRQIAGEPLTDARIAKLLGNYRNAPLGMAVEDGDEFRISIAGAQEKTALLWHDGAWQRPLGATPTTHIFKLPIGQIEYSGMDLRDSCENEWLCLKIARAFDLPVCDAAVRWFDGEKALVVERFDRRLGEGWIMRLPQEDMCQALGYSPNIKYESDGGPGVGEIMRFLLQSREAGPDRERFYNSLVLFWLIAAIDGHAKNFSVFIEAGGRYRLTPLYDIMSAHPLMAQKQLYPGKIKMAMALSGKNRHYHWHTMQPRHFISTSEHVGFHAETARRLFNDMLDRVDTVVDKVKKDLPPDFPDAIATQILAGMLKQRDAAIRGGRL